LRIKIIRVELSPFIFIFRLMQFVRPNKAFQQDAVWLNSAKGRP